jgi:hypothetical protein
MVIDPDTGEQLDLTPTSWPLPHTDGRAHRQPVALTVTTTARWDDLPADIRAAVDGADPDLRKVLRELLDYPLTADDLDNQPDAEQPSAALAEHVTSRGASTERPHRIKTFTDWTVRQINRSWEWTSPTGRRYTIEPHDYRLGP